MNPLAVELFYFLTGNLRFPPFAEPILSSAIDI